MYHSIIPYHETFCLESSEIISSLHWTENMTGQRHFTVSFTISKHFTISKLGYKSIFHLTLSQTIPCFYVSATTSLLKNCLKRRNCL